MTTEQDHSNKHEHQDGCSYGYLKKRAVVSSLIFRFPDSENGSPQVALFKRSDKVHTYRHHLAPISGSIEANEDAIDSAWRELKEETTLDSRSLAHWRTGKAFTFSDPSEGREWTVHPIAYRLKTPEEGGGGEERIHTDWEHEGWQWHDPQELVKGGFAGCVPRLGDTLDRVYFENRCPKPAGQALAKGLERLRNDHESGSRQLTTVAIEIFREFVIQMPVDVNAEWWRTVKMGAWHLWKNGRESMGAAILNALLVLLDDLSKNLEKDQQRPNNDDTPRNKRDIIISVFNRHLSARQTMTQRIKTALASYLRSQGTPHEGKQRPTSMRVVTVSASSTVHDTILDAFSELDVETLDLRILESRPLYEGVTLASSIADQFKSRFGTQSSSSSSPSTTKKLDISIFTDASAIMAARGAHVILIGADRISSAGGVSNKIGSLPAILGSKYTWPDMKVIVLTETDKIARSSEFAAEENDPQEVMAGWSTGHVKGVEALESCMAKKDTCADNVRINVRNIYFEWVPLDLVDAVVCEDGILNVKAIQERSKHIEDGVNKFFGDL